MSRAQPIQSGELREVLTVQNETRVSLPGGSSTTTWTDQGALRARVRTLRGREHLLARQVVGATVYEVTTRAQLPPDTVLSSRSRLVWSSPTGTRTLEATEPPRLDSTGRFFTFLCSEREAT